MAIGAVYFYLFIFSFAFLLRFSNLPWPCKFSENDKNCILTVALSEAGVNKVVKDI